MLFSEFKKRLKKGDISLSIRLEELTRQKIGNRVFVSDNRTYCIKEKGWTVKPIAQSAKQVFIVCPYCGNIHVHGICDGSRVSHCDNYTGEYFIEL